MLEGPGTRPGASLQCSLVPRLHSPAFYRTAFIHGAIKGWGVESGNEAIYGAEPPEVEIAGLASSPDSIPQLFIAPCMIIEIPINSLNNAENHPNFAENCPTSLKLVEIH